MSATAARKNMLIEALNAQRDTRDSRLLEGSQLGPVESSGVHFERDFTIA
jgi:hypothetical protein